MTEAALQQYIQAIRPADRAVMDAARERQAAVFYSHPTLPTNSRG